MTMPDGNTASLKLYEAQQDRADRDFKDYGGQALDDVVDQDGSIPLSAPAAPLSCECGKARYPDGKDALRARK